MPKPASASTSSTNKATTATAAKVWRTYHGGGNTANDSEKDFIEKHLPLVKTVVDRIKMHLPSHVDADDLYSVGVTGLICAVRKFDPSQGNTFIGYASLHIRGAVLDELRRLDWMPRSARVKAKKLKEVIQGMEQRLGRAVEEEEIAEELAMDSDEYGRLLDEVRPVCFISLDGDPSPSEEQNSLHEIIPDENQEMARESLEKKELMGLVSERIQQLPEVQKKVLAMYYFENMRLAEIAEVFNLTESRICQIHAQAVLSLRAYMHTMLAN